MSRNTKRLAVVIGNSDYEHLASLTNPTNDANAVKDTLHSLGYEVSLGINLERKEVLEHFAKVLDSWKREASEILVYYSGHGLSIDGKAHIAPVDARTGVYIDLIEDSFYNVEKIIRLLLNHRKDDKYPIIIILDCCRSKITSDFTHSHDQVDTLQSPRGEFGNKSNIAILYSTAYGEPALDGNGESDHSPYTKLLLDNIVKDLTIYEINTIITKALGEFGGKQVSWMYQCLLEPYRFKHPISSINSQETSLTSKDAGMRHFYGVPPRNHNFVDRPKIISTMQHFLNERPTINDGNFSNILVLKGLGGMGKSQLMLQYCYLHHQEYDYVFWLEADGRIVTHESFRKLAIDLYLDEEVIKEKHKEEKIVDFVCSWFEKKPKWLLLLDNVDEVMATELFKVLPRVGGDIILTTREPISPAKAKVVPVYKMEEDEALSLLLNSLTIDYQNEEHGKEIVVELGSMPLAISLACAYIENVQVSFKRYLDILKNQRNELFLHHDKDSSQQYNHTLTTVWKLSFERVRTLDPLAGVILDTSAFLQPDSIPVIFFEKQWSTLKDGLIISSPSSDSENRNSESWRRVRGAIAVLVRFSFVTRISKEHADNDNEEEEFLIIHRLVQKATFNELNDNQKICLAYNTAKAFNNEIKFSDSYAAATRKIMNTYLSHVRHFVTLLDELNQNPLLSIDLENLLVRTVDYLLENWIYVGVEILINLALSLSKLIHGEDSLSVTLPLELLARLFLYKGIYVSAEPLYQRSLIITEKELGPEHPDTATSLNNLASLYDKQGKYTDAEPLYQRALIIREKALGPEHPSTATSLNNLASLYENQGKYTDAEPLYQRALIIREKALGPEHPDTAFSLNSLASFCKNQGKYTDAEPLYQRALIIYEKTLGPEHPATAVSLNNLALLYDSQGKYTDAEPLYQRALIIDEKALGPEHLHTATSLNNLATLYRNQGKYSDSEILYQRALIIEEKTLGPEHPDTATSLNNLASLYYTQGKYTDAEPLHQRALIIREKVLGPEHPYTATSLNNLASLYRKQGKYTDAEPLYQRALIIMEKALGPEHPYTVNPLISLALIYKNQGRYTDAEPLYQRALIICEKSLGPEHPNTAISLSGLAVLYGSQGKYSDAEPLHQRALMIREKALGPEHPDTATSLNDLAVLYGNQGKHTDAEPLYQRALMIREKALGPEHPDTATSLNNLALLYDNQGKYIDAEPLYQRALLIREKALGPEHPDTATTLNNLASLYDNQGKYTDAELLYQRAMIIREKVLGPEHSMTINSRNALESLYRKHRP